MLKWLAVNLFVIVFQCALCSFGAILAFGSVVCTDMPFNPRRLFIGSVLICFTAVWILNRSWCERKSEPLKYERGFLGHPMAILLSLSLMAVAAGEYRTDRERLQDLRTEYWRALNMISESRTKGEMTASELVSTKPIKDRVRARLDLMDRDGITAESFEQVRRDIEALKRSADE